MHDDNMLWQLMWLKAVSRKSSAAGTAWIAPGSLLTTSWAEQPPPSILPALPSWEGQSSRLAGAIHARVCVDL
jgi:hypothetical protein